MLEKSYNAPEREPEIATKWEEKNLFACHPESVKPAFSIVIPPPNVTGNLHIGHALRGVQHRDFGSIDVLKPLQRGFAGVPAGCD